MYVQSLTLECCFDIHRRKCIFSLLSVKQWFLRGGPTSVVCDITNSQEANQSRIFRIKKRDVENWKLKLRVKLVVWKIFFIVFFYIHDNSCHFGDFIEFVCVGGNFKRFPNITVISSNQSMILKLPYKSVMEYDKVYLLKPCTYLQFEVLVLFLNICNFFFFWTSAPIHFRDKYSPLY